MTLFAEATKRDLPTNPDNRAFLDALIRYFDGEPDQATLDRL